MHASLYTHKEDEVPLAHAEAIAFEVFVPSQLGVDDHQRIKRQGAALLEIYQQELLAHATAARAQRRVRLGQLV